MVLSEDIAIQVRQVMLDAGLTDVVWQRSGYEKKIQYVIVPHMTTGESSLRTAVVKVNIHVPDIYNNRTKAYEPNLAKLVELKHLLADTLKRYVWHDTGINWNITGLDAPLKEPSYNEHFASLTIEAHIREKHR